MQHFDGGGKIKVNGNLWVHGHTVDFNWGVSNYSIYKEPVKVLRPWTWEEMCENMDKWFNDRLEVECMVKIQTFNKTKEEIIINDAAYTLTTLLNCYDLYDPKTNKSSRCGIYEDTE